MEQRSDPGIRQLQCAWGRRRRRRRLHRDLRRLDRHPAGTSRRLGLGRSGRHLAARSVEHRHLQLVYRRQQCQRLGTKSGHLHGDRQPVSDSNRLDQHRAEQRQQRLDLDRHHWRRIGRHHVSNGDDRGGSECAGQPDAECSTKYRSLLQQQHHRHRRRHIGQPECGGQRRRLGLLERTDRHRWREYLRAWSRTRERNLFGRSRYLRFLELECRRRQHHADWRKQRSLGSIVWSLGHLGQLRNTAGARHFVDRFPQCDQSLRDLRRRHLQLDADRDPFAGVARHQ